MLKFYGQLMSAFHCHAVMPAVVKVRPNRGLGHFQSKRRSGSADSEINRYKYFVISLITKF